MTSRALAALLAPLLLLAPGCGTLITHRASQDTEAFAGCKADLFVISAPFMLAAGDPSCLTPLLPDRRADRPALLVRRRPVRDGRPRG